VDLAEIPGRSFRRHPWEVVRARFFARQLQTVLEAQASTSVLDVGAGDGFFAAMLCDETGAGQVTCFDPGYEQVDPADLRVPSAARFTAEEPAGVYDVITLLDVLEHVEDDRGFLQHLVTDRLRSGGHMLVSVPAWPALFSSHDRKLNHFRRYSPRAALGLLLGVRLEVLRSGGAFHSLVVPRAAQVAWERLNGRRADGEAPSLEWRSGPRMARVAEACLSVDTGFSLLVSERRWQVPGLTWWALCRKP
jgi:trans-aconitate methyltransferase